MANAELTLQNVHYTEQTQNGFQNVLIADFSGKFPEIRENIIELNIREPKTRTALATCISGVTKPQSGLISVLRGDKQIQRICFIPASTATIPWLSIEENLEILYKATTVEKNISLTAIPKIIAKVELEGYEKHRIHQSSAIMQFRLMMAHALLHGCDAVVIDNYLANVESQYLADEVSFISRLAESENLLIINISADSVFQKLTTLTNNTICHVLRQHSTTEIMSDYVGKNQSIRAQKGANTSWRRRR